MCLTMLKIALLLSLINVNAAKMALCENVHKITTTDDFQTQEKANASSLRKQPVKETHVNQDTRFRRATNSKSQDKCSTAAQCTGNQTFYQNVSFYYNCYCDNACYETFRDCCPDFVETCGEQRKTKNKDMKPLWTCLAVGDWNTNYNEESDQYCNLYGPSGIWMIANCSRNWALDKTRTKCENTSEKFSFPVEDFLPVVSTNGFTYRNKHCAECNGETRYQTWLIVAKGPLTPPEQYNLDDKLRFLLANEGEIKNIAPATEMPRRYCAGARYKDDCANMSYPAYEECINGPVQTTTVSGRRYFKNSACALCNGETPHFEEGERSMKICSVQGVPVGLSIIFQKPSSESTVTRVVKKQCLSGLVYDDTFGFCREGVITNIDDTLSYVFLLTLWFEPGAIEIPPVLAFNFDTGRILPIGNANQLSNHLKLSLVKRFALRPSQLTTFQFHRQNLRIATTSLVATFHLKLTPYQEFVLNNENTSSLKTSTGSHKFLELLKFKTKFTMESGGYRFPVIKLVSKQLACFEGTTLQSHEYEIGKISGNLIEKTSGRVFSKNEYVILGKIGENITICRRLVLSECHNGAFVTLSEHEYYAHKNLTIFHYQTKRTFNFGEYQIIEGGSSNETNLDIFQNASFPRKSAIAICLPYRKTYNTTKKIKVVVKSYTGNAIRVLTLVCFTVSLLFLSILLVTYGIFEELRTLPGINLMSLAVSMLLSQLVWLIGTTKFMNTKTCEVLGMIEHYLFLVAFMAMSVISYHSCIVFSRPFSTSHDNAMPAWTKFAKYSSIAWISPAIFIAVCVTLDQTDATFSIYGTTCWLSTEKAVLYLFILPAAVIMLFNIVAFIKTALALCHNNVPEILHRNRDRKQNLIACIKLATLVAFPWLFGFLGVIFPDTEAFQYLFVVFACLQGFYMGVAFVCNKKTFLLYKNWWTRRNAVSPQPNLRTETLQMS